MKPKPNMAVSPRILSAAKDEAPLYSGTSLRTAYLRTAIVRKSLATLGITLGLVTLAWGMPSVQIETHFRSFEGRPSWLLMIRDVDHNENIPYLFDITKGNNIWMAAPYGRNYLIAASTLQFSPYKSNPYRSKLLNNFCHLESNGRIIRGESMIIRIEGNLTPNPKTYKCVITTYPNPNN
jgi:hypothetical protein